MLFAKIHFSAKKTYSSITFFVVKLFFRSPSLRTTSSMLSRVARLINIGCRSAIFGILKTAPGIHPTMPCVVWKTLAMLAYRKL